MINKRLHIVALDVPWPADYGGAIELFYKLKALHQLGIKIHLHCFYKNRKPQEELNKYCETVQYYPRKKNIISLSFRLPLIVKSRKNDALIANLNKDNYPILLEGIHCTYYLHTGKLRNRNIVIRLHNAEFEYYKQLAKSEFNFFKKLYFLYESKRLFTYEKNIVHKAQISAISQQDVELYLRLFDAKSINYIPAFVPHHFVLGKIGIGNFCLYHGNLSINENEVAALWLLQNVFNNLPLPFVIAGKNPSKKLQKIIAQYPHAKIIANPDQAQMQELIENAQLHVLPSFNNTGIKLKLLNALFNGRHCLVNNASVLGSGLESLCHIASDTKSFELTIKNFYVQPFTEQEKQKRKILLQSIFDNDLNAKKLSATLGFQL